MAGRETGLASLRRVSLVPSQGQEESDGKWGWQGLQELPNPAGSELMAESSCVFSLVPFNKNKLPFEMQAYLGCSKET